MVPHYPPAAVLTEIVFFGQCQQYHWFPAITRPAVVSRRLATNRSEK
jgi:hypothetical protein